MQLASFAFIEGVLATPLCQSSVQNSHVVKLSGCHELLQLVENKNCYKLDTRPPSCNGRGQLRPTNLAVLYFMLSISC